MLNEPPESLAPSSPYQPKFAVNILTTKVKKKEQTQCKFNARSVLTNPLNSDPHINDSSDRRRKIGTSPSTTTSSSSGAFIPYSISTIPPRILHVPVGIICRVAVVVGRSCSTFGPDRCSLSLAVRVGRGTVIIAATTNMITLVTGPPPVTTRVRSTVLAVTGRRFAC